MEKLIKKQAFFNVILRELGVKDVKIQELFGVDEDSLGFLPYVSAHSSETLQLF